MTSLEIRMTYADEKQSRHGKDLVCNAKYSSSANVGYCLGQLISKDLISKDVDNLVCFQIKRESMKPIAIESPSTLHPSDYINNC